MTLNERHGKKEKNIINMWIVTQMEDATHIVVIHGTCYVDESGAKFLFWSETPEGRGQGDSIHPFASDSNKTLKFLRNEINVKNIKLSKDDLAAFFPTFGDTPLLSNQISGLTSDDYGSTEIEEPKLVAWSVPSVLVDIKDAFTFLAGIQGESTNAIFGSDLLFWKNVSQFVYNILSEQKILPTVIEEGSAIRSRWIPILETSEDQSTLMDLVKDMPQACLAFNYEQIDPESLVKTYMNSAVDGFCRSQINEPAISSHVGDALKWATSLSLNNSLITFGRSLAIKKISNWSRMIQNKIEFPLRMTFDLIPPEAEKDPWRLRFMLQSKSDPSLIIPFERIWGRHDEQAVALVKKYIDFPEEFLLQSLGIAQMIFAPIRKALQSANPSEVSLTSDEVYAFLRDYSKVLEESGYSILFPEWWGTKSGNLGLKISVAPTSGNTRKILGLETLVDYDLDIVLNGETIDLKELERLAALKSRLVHVGKKWLEVDAEQLNRILKMLRGRKDGIGLGQLLSMTTEENKLPILDITGEGWLKDLFKKEIHLLGGEQPPSFNGNLREYQKQGFSWLDFMSSFGFGSCLADDMGMGKTIEVIAFLLKRHENMKKPGVTLVVCPTSVISNWLHEIKRFAPSIRTLVHHGNERMKQEELVNNIVNYDVVVTSYSLLSRDIESLSKITWEGIVADEAQYIKNSGTKQSRAIRSLKSDFKIALTGTPIENRLEDLRSIFDFINPGYLGNEKKFKKLFSDPIIKEEDDTAVDRLGKLVNPFILRRVKTDKKIISDLPEKEEMKLYVPVSEEQASLYEAIVKAMLEDVSGLQGIKRSGIILSTITKLKRLMDHPSLVSGDKNYNPERSEKVVRLLDMLDETIATGEKTLVFTQYVEAGKIIKELILKRFNKEALFLSGSVPRIIREQMIERFQDPSGPKIFVLSVRAGGFGINLTAAANVIHFDRWWNPAVENQATDRAYRIGQSKLVHVYKFISTGTIEEKIDEIIEGKTLLSKKIVKSTDESWMTTLSTKELKDLFALRKETVAERGV